jgi:hypothetical protein
MPSRRFSGGTKRPAAGALTVDLVDTGTTTLALDNSGTGAANLNIVSGSLQLAGTTRLANNGDATLAATTVSTLTAATSATSPTYTGSGAVTVSSGGAGALTLYSASNTLTIGSTDTTLTATGTDESTNTSEFSGNVVVQTATLLDFGDAPDSYATLLATNGPRHTLAAPFLGANRDGETDGQPSADATGDDTNGTPDDEDGVTIPGGTLTRGTTNSITVVSSANFAELDGFIDLNIDGDFAYWQDPSSASVHRQSLSTGKEEVIYDAPRGFAISELATGGGTIAISIFEDPSQGTGEDRPPRSSVVVLSAPSGYPSGVIAEGRFPTR